MKDNDKAERKAQVNDDPMKRVVIPVMNSGNKYGQDLPEIRNWKWGVTNLGTACSQDSDPASLSQDWNPA